MTVTNRRRISASINSNRIVTPQFNIQQQEDAQEFQFQESLYAVRHLPFPNVPFTTEIINELLLFVFTLFCAALQFIHLYRRTSLPYQTSVNLYLIDPFLAMFILIISSRRLLYCLLEKVAIEYLCPKKYLDVVKMGLKYFFLIHFFLLLLACSFKIFQKYSFLYIICLSYPLLLYLFIFRLKIEPFLKMNAPEDDVALMNGFPVHSCSINAQSIRAEIETLKNDFNNRFKQVVFTSVLNAYYAGFIPLCFVYKHLYYDTLFATQHLAFSFLGCFTLSIAFVFPVKYADVLHRASLHLGVWNKTSTRNHPPPLLWNKTIIWPFGTYVKFSGDVYRSNSISTCATPANNSHYRFYLIFKNPSNVYFIVATAQAALVFIQILLLSFISKEWQHILSLCFLILFNFYSLFRLSRDFWVAKNIYSAETSVNEKLRSGNLLNSTGNQ